MTGFGWRLSSHRANEGRYLERFAFHVSDVAHTGKAYSYSVTAGLSSPGITTFFSNATTSLASVLITTEAATKEQRVTEGAICMDDLITGFRCEDHGLVSQLSTSVPL